MKKTLILFIFLWTAHTFAQSPYAKYIVADSLKKPQTVKHKDGGYEKATYLGAIKKSNGDTLYYVFSVFTAVQAAIVMHGHSSVIYLNKKLKEVKNYEAGSPEELPYKLLNNTLYFRYLDEKTNKKQIFKNKVGTTPPAILCYAPDRCM